MKIINIRTKLTPKSDVFRWIDQINAIFKKLIFPTVLSPPEKTLKSRTAGMAQDFLLLTIIVNISYNFVIKCKCGVKVCQVILLD